MVSTEKIPEAEWLRVESIIRRLYVDEDMTLDALRDYLSTNHAFSATKSQCTTKFKAWKLKKNADSMYWRGIRGSLKRKGLAVEDVNVTANGELISCKKLKKELQRYAEHEPQDDSECTPPATPAGIKIEAMHLRHDRALSVPAPRRLAISLPSRAFFDAWKLVPSSPVLEDLQLSPSNLLLHQNMTGNLSPFCARNSDPFFATTSPSSWKSGIILPAFDLPQTNSHSDSLLEAMSSDLRDKERYSLQQDVNKYFGIDHKPKSLAQHLRPYVIERQPEETSNAVRALMDPSSRDTMQVLMSYLTLLLSNDLLPDSAIDAFVSLADEMQHLRSLNSLFSHTTPSARAVATRVLHAAVKANAIQFLRKAIKSGADIESVSTGYFTTTLLQQALLSERPSVARMLIDFGADVNAGRTEAWRLNCLGLAFHQMNIVCTCQHIGQDSPLRLAAGCRSCVDIIPHLLKNGAILPECPILAFAIKNGANETLVRTLLNAGANVNDLDLYHRTEDPCNGALSPLEAAISCSNSRVVELLLDLGADPHYLALAELSVLPQDLPFGQRTELPLAQASNLDGDEESLEIIRMLLRRGANPNADPVDMCSLIHDPDSISFFERDLEHGEGRCSPLQNAARRGDNAMIEVLLTAGATTKPRFGVPPLTTAIWCSQFESAKLLLSRGADPNEVSPELYCPSSLDAAVKSDNLEMIDLLLSYGVDINKRSSDHGGRTPLQRAAEEGNQDIIDHLISKGASMHSEPASIEGISVLQGFVENGLVKHAAKAVRAGARTDHEIEHGRSPLTAAVVRHSMPLIHMLLAAGADVHAYAEVRPEDLDIPDRNRVHKTARRSPIQWAATMNYVDVAEVLCAAGANIDQSPQGWHGMTAVTVAIELRNNAMVRFLLSRNVDLTIEPNLESPISLAVSFRDKLILRLLLRHVASPNQVDYSAGGEEDDTCLAQACTAKNLEMVQCHVDQGYALSQAVGSSKDDWDPEIMDLLLSYGANVNKRNHTGDTPLQVAIMAQRFECALKLISRGARINDPPSKGAKGFYFHYGRVRIDDEPSEKSMGRTALQAAVDVGDVDMVEFLLSKGADVNAPAALVCGVTALQAAAIRGFLRIAQILLENGAQIGAAAGVENGRTAIDGAAQFGRIDMVQLLLDNYDGLVSELDLMKSAYRAAKRGKEWFVMELLQNRWESLGGAPGSLRRYADGWDSDGGSLEISDEGDSDDSSPEGSDEGDSDDTSSEGSEDS